MASTNIDFDEQSTRRWLLNQLDQMQVQGLTLDEEGMTATFYQTEVPEDALYLTPGASIHRKRDGNDQYTRFW